jgi:hypothetical protein
MQRKYGGPHRSILNEKKEILEIFLLSLAADVKDACHLVFYHTYAENHSHNIIIIKKDLKS